MSLRLLIDCVGVTSPGGSQNRVELARAAESLCPDGWDILFMQAAGAPGLASSETLRIVEVERRPGWLGMRDWYHRALPEIARREAADVAYSLSGILSRALCRSCGTVNSINNMLPFTPEHIGYFRPLSRDWLRLIALQKLYVWGCRHADAVVLPSRYGLDRVNHYAGDLSDKSFVAMNPIPEFAKCDPESPPQHPYGGKPFLFYLSVVFWYKNHLNLIEGYRRALGAGHELPDLVLAGPPDEARYVRRIEQAIANGGLRDRVKYLGKIPREDIPGWLHHATINVFPSTCETNSYVQAEILGAQGVMACSDCGPMPEVAGDAAELFDPWDPDSIGNVLIRLSRDEERRAELRKLAARRCEELTVRATGEQIWQAVQRARNSFLERSGS